MAELLLTPYGMGRLAYLEQYHKAYLLHLLKTKQLLQHLRRIEQKAQEVEEQNQHLPPGGAQEVVFETVVSPQTDEDEEEYSEAEKALLRKLWKENFPGVNLHRFLFLQG